MKAKILIASNPGSLLEALSHHRKTATVEAEYGDDVVHGTVCTLAHHGPRHGALCPCLFPSMSVDVQVIGISHFDLDTLGGILAVVGDKPDYPAFWEAAAWVDTHGPHKLHEAPIDPLKRTEVEEQLHAWWAYGEAHRIFAPKGVEVADVTAQVITARDALKAILSGDMFLLAEGRTWKAAKEQLDVASFVKSAGGVILRRSGEFTNHLYRSDRVVVAFNEKFQSVTVSAADKGILNCREVVQDLWGPQAGGHENIAGSPRGRTMTFEDAEQAFERVVNRLA